MNTSRAAVDVTSLLHAWGRGDEQALDRLVPLVYDELHRLARGYMARERAGHTLQTTALVNEAYLRMVDARGVDWKDRAHFFAICARTMRRILIDSARARRYEKRGAGQSMISLDESLAVGLRPGKDLLALDDALIHLAEIDPRKSEVVELRFFGGLSVEETAEALRISPKTVKRDWKMAKAWLHCHLSGEGLNGT